MFLGFFDLEATLKAHLQMKNGNAPVTPDAAPTFRIYVGTSSTVVANGTCSAEVDSQTGMHLMTQALTGAAGFARGAYTVRIAYDVSAAAKAQEYSFQVV